MDARQSKSSGFVMVGVIVIAAAWLFATLQIISPQTSRDALSLGWFCAGGGIFCIWMFLEVAGSGLTARMFHPLTWSVKTLVSNRWLLGGIAVAIAFGGSFAVYRVITAPASYSECVLRYMPQARDAYIAEQVKTACQEKFPAQ